MARTWSDWVTMGASTAGTVAGGVFGGPTGASVGASAGGLLGTGLSMLDRGKRVEAPGQTRQEAQSLFMSGEVAKRAMALQGASAGQVGRIQQSGREATMRTMAETATIGRQLSPFDKAKLMETLREHMTKSPMDIMDVIERYASGKETQNLAVQAQATATHAKVAQEQADRERLRHERQLELDRQRNTAFEKAMSAFGQIFAMPGFDILGKGSGGEEAETGEHTISPEARAPSYERALARQQAIDERTQGREDALEELRLRNEELELEIYRQELEHRKFDLPILEMEDVQGWRVT